MTNPTAPAPLASTWQDACSDVKGAFITTTATAATALAAKYLEAGVLTTGDYIALVRWSEGRPSYAARPYAVELVAR